MQKEHKQYSFTVLTVICILVIVLALALSACGNEAARYGIKTMTVNLECDRKLVTLSWKTESNTSPLWILTRPMRPDETPETYTYQSKSTFGLLEGKVNINECKATN